MKRNNNFDQFDIQLLPFFYTEHPQKLSVFFMKCYTNGIFVTIAKFHARYAIVYLEKIHFVVICDCIQTNAFSNVISVN